MTLDFDKKEARAENTLHFTSLVNNLKRVRLDSRFLEIHHAYLDGDKTKQLTFKEKTKNKEIGPMLEVRGIKVNKGENFTITIGYRTTDKGLSLNWLDKEQTAGKK